MIVIFDGHAAVGGGQVVLAELARLLSATSPVAVAGPRNAAVRELLPPAARNFDTGSQTAALRELADADGAVLVANTYASLVGVRRTARLIRRRGGSARTAAVLHSYPRSAVRRMIVRWLLRGINDVLPVEPGLQSLAPTCRALPLLSIRLDQVRTIAEPVVRTGSVKSFGRPDKVKGFDLFPAIVERVEATTALRFRIALGASLDGDDTYTDALRASLEPWLEDGGRDPSWIEPGDIVLVTSRSEGTCLSAQEAMAAGAFVVASDVGAMPALTTADNSLVTYEVEDVAAAAAAIASVASMRDREFARRCSGGVTDITTRAGAWYSQVATILSGSLRDVDRQNTTAP